MALEAIKGASVYSGMDSAKPQPRTTQVEVNTATTQNVEAVQTQVGNVSNNGNGETANEDARQQQMSQKFVSEAVNNANNHMPIRTKCEFAYDETTKRISITIRDKETDEIIREVPPKETLEMVAKMWELAGILVDEKR